MFVWQNRDLPPDPEYPADLEQLGYFINENDQIRQIAHPEEEFKYRINRNERFNIKQREAMNECIRNIVLARLQEAGLQIMRLPYRQEPPRESHPDEAHVPTLVSPNLHNARRIIVVFGEASQDLGIWSYRTVGTEGINKGSAVDFVKAVRGDGNWEKTEDATGTRTDTALVLANTGQLIWHCAGSRAITSNTFLANPRPAGNWGPASTSYRNQIPGNGTWQQHVSYVFENVLLKNLHASTRIDVIGMSEGGLGVINHMKEQWAFWRPYISGIILGDPLHYTSIELDQEALTDPKPFTAFVSSRCIAYVLSPDELGKVQTGYPNHGCNCYSAGEALNSEGILPSAWPDMLSWLDKVYKEPEYAEPMMFMETDMDEMGWAMEGSKMADDGLGEQDAISNVTVEAELMVEDGYGDSNESSKGPVTQGYEDGDDGYVADSEGLCVVSGEDTETP